MDSITGLGRLFWVPTAGGRWRIEWPRTNRNVCYAGETVELAHHWDGMLRIYRGEQLLLALPLPLEEHAERRPKTLTSAQKRKLPMPRIYDLSGRPALAAVT